MKIRNRIIVILLISILVSFSITGCRSKGSEDLINAFRKSFEMESFSSKTHMDMEFDFEMDMSSLDEYDQMMINSYKGMMQNIEADLEQKYMREEDKYLMEQDISYNFGGVGFKFKMWQDYSLEQDNFEMKQIIEIPQIFKSFFVGLGPEMANVEYFVYDWSDYMALMEEEGVNLDMERLVRLGQELGYDLQETFLIILGDFHKEYKNSHDKEIISYIGNEKESGEKIDIYEMNFDDKSFKDFLRFTTNYILEKEDTEDIIEEYLTLIGDLIYQMDQGYSSKEEIESEIDEMLGELDLDEAKNTFNEFMDAFEDADLLGDKEISLTYKVNKEGYLVGCNGVVDFEIDFKEISDIIVELYPEAFEYYDSDQELPVIYLTLDFDVQISDINQVQNIEFPELNEDNSLDFIDLMEDEFGY